jgi:hypothetical protein
MSEVTEVKVSFISKMTAVIRSIEAQRPDALLSNSFAEECHSAAKKWQLRPPISIQ